MYGSTPAMIAEASIANSIISLETSLFPVKFFNILNLFSLSLSRGMIPNSENVDKAI